MSTPTFKALCLGMILTLGGCQVALLPLGGSTGITESITLQGGMTITAPDGYCVDPTATQGTFTASAVTMFSCARLNDATADDPTEGRMFTATATEGTISNQTAFARYLKTDAGKALLSSGADVTVHQTRTTRVATYIDYSDETLPVHLGQRVWRAFVNTGNGLAVLTLYSGQGDPISGSNGEGLIRAFAAQTVNAN
ncbi:MAG: hypothetical protein ACPG5U_00615 [Planktomarina sp.]